MVRPRKTNLSREQYLAKQKKDAAARKKIIRKEFNTVKKQNPDLTKQELYVKTVESLAEKIPGVTERAVRSATPATKPKKHIGTMQEAAKRSISETAEKKATKIRDVYMWLLSQKEINRMVREEGIDELDRMIADSLTGKGTSHKTVKRARIGMVGHQRAFPPLEYPAKEYIVRGKETRKRTVVKREKADKTVPKSKLELGQLRKEIAGKNTLIMRFKGDPVKFNKNATRAQLERKLAEQQEQLDYLRVLKKPFARDKNVGYWINRFLGPSGNIDWTRFITANQRETFITKHLPKLPEETQKLLKRKLRLE